MTHYGTSRKVGVGFNYHRVLGGVMQFDWRRVWDTSRRMVQAQRYLGKRPSGAVDAHRQMVGELKPKKRRGG